ncbi:MAG TPA: VOC family protein [Candidatus Nanopelagicaceae bacterium]|nr:VOC family protein [Candidatus Nanopelagicaceae bacterium]
MAIAKFAVVALDCPDPISLAEFYALITGWPIAEDRIWRNESGIVGWAQLDAGGSPTIGFARVDNYRAPTWPEGDIPQQEHLDFQVSDLDVGEVEVLKIGAVKAEHQPGESFRIFFDPAGHPFCLVNHAD